MSKLPAVSKLAAVRRVLAGQSQVQIAAELGCCRQSLYLWSRRYKKSHNPGYSLFKPKYRRGKLHHKAISPKVERLVLDLVIKWPGLGPDGLVLKLEKLGVKVSKYGVYRILVRHNLQLAELRFEYKHAHPSGTVFANKLNGANRVKIVEEHLFERKNITEVCRKWQISRTTFYAWLKRYQEASDASKVSNESSLVESMARRYKRGCFHHRAISEEVRDKILVIVRANPVLSVHKVYAALPVVNGQPIATHQAVQNLFGREGLNTCQMRLDWVKETPPEGEGAVAPLYVPETPLWRLRMLLAPFVTVPKLWVSNPLKGLLATLLISLPISFFILWLRLLVNAPAGTSHAGLVLATVALFFGLFFFLYSLKYYLTILMILRFATQGERKAANQAKASPLLINFEKVELTEKPFVSIHVALYNEKSVVERLIKACTSQEWHNQASRPVGQWAGRSSSNPTDLQAQKPNNQIANYEVILVDDSTDETTEIAKEVLVSGIGYQVSRTYYDDELEIFYFTPSTVGNLPVIKLIHRFTRSGFKGGALQKALENTDVKAQHIVIFDADFIPYPDTVEQFVKTFQVLGASGNQAIGNAVPGNPNTRVPNNPAIAAVQGYQWHVLNKSQTWVTRGVRTEYAGSYVIERSGAEIYGGLKQIAGAVYAIRADILRKFGWGTSITEDFELTLRLYEAGYKVAFTPYIQAPAEVVPTIKKLIRQRMRWAEGASHNVKIMFGRMLTSPNLTFAERLEFFYLAPYYLQAAFFVVGTLAWFLSETIFHTKLPFWTAALGWSLILTNLLSLPLMNIVGLFLEESSEKDYVGIFSFIALSYIMVPFQAYAAIKGFLEPSEGPWFRTPKTGAVTDVFDRSKFSKFFGNLLGRPSPTGFGTVGSTTVSLQTTDYRPPTKLALVGAPSFNKDLWPRPKQIRRIGNLFLTVIVSLTLFMSILAPLIPVSNSYASETQLKTIENTQKESSSPHKNPQNKDEILRNALGKEITTPRAIRRTTKGGKNLEVIFHAEPRVRVKLENQEIEFETKTIGGKRVSPAKSKIYNDREVTYEEIIKDVDLKYTMTNDLLVEEFIIKNQSAIQQFSNLAIEQSVKTVDVKVVSPDPSTFGFYSNDGRELFKLSAPFAKDAGGETSNDLAITLEKDYIGHKLTKSLGESAKVWLNDPNRQYPISIDPSVVVSGGIAEAEVQFGGLQRKVAFVNGNWYAFYNDATDVFYKKSSDGSSWGSAVDIDTTDADNLNPSIWVEGNTIYVTWIDDSTDSIEVNTIDTASADALGTKCTSADLGTIDTTSFTVSIAVDDFGDVYLAITDTGADAEVFIFNLTFSGCTFTDITANSGITAGDRPVLISPGMGTAVIFQDADLSVSITEGAGSQTPGATWPISNNTIASVTDNIYAATTDGTTTWLLTVSGTTATNFYTLGLPSYSDIDTTVGTTGQASIYCPAADDCKVAYNDSTDADITFADCNDAACSAPTITDIDTDVGTTGQASIYCPAADDCKVAYFDGTDADITFADCNDAACSAPIITDIDTDVGTTGQASIYCPTAADCKVAYNDSTDQDITFADCNDAACSAPTITDIDTAVNTTGQASIYCPAADDCKVAYYDRADSDVTFADCNDGACSAPTITDIDTAVSTTAKVSIYCPTAADCKVAYFDGIDQDLTFTDCNDAACYAVTDSADPWTGETNLTSVSLTYDSTNSDLYAHVIMNDPSSAEQAFWKSTDATTISWTPTGDGNSYAFTAGDLGHISASLTGAGTSQIGVVLRQGTNFEFSAVPEKTIFLLVAVPFLPKVLGRLKKKKGRRGVIKDR